MSTENDKFRNSKRRLKDENAIKKQLKIAKSSNNTSKAVTQPHRLAKRHAMDCGQPNCIICGNPRKIFNEKTIQEKSFDQNLDKINNKKSNGTKNEN